MEFAQFLEHECLKAHLCDDTSTIEFDHLNTQLQLEFIFGVCSHDDEKEEKEKCIGNLKETWRKNQEFGFDVKTKGRDELRKDVKEMCVNSFEFVVEMGLIGTAGEFPLSMITKSQELHSV